MLRREILKGTAIGLALALAPLLVRADAAGDGASRKLQSELTKYYRLSTASLGAEGAAGIVPGQILTLRRDGVVGFSEADQAMEEICPAVFRNGEPKTEKSTLCSLSAKHSAKSFHAGEAVCVTAIQVSTEQDTVSMYAIACGGSRRAPITHTYYARLVFQFGKGSLRTASAAKVEETINQVVSRAGAEAQIAPAPRPQEPKPVAASDPAPKGNTVPEPQAVPALPPVPAPEQVAPAAPASPEPAEKPVPEPPAVPALPPVPEASSNPVPATAPTEPAVTEPAAATASSGIAEGQSMDQVKAVLGEPNRVAELGEKTIFFYPGLKVVFGSGKVSKIEKQNDNQ